MREKTVERYIRRYLINNGWEISNAPKRKGEHGVDIIAMHPKRRKYLYIETKGSGGKKSAQTIHNAFNSIIGQFF